MKAKLTIQNLNTVQFTTFVTAIFRLKMKYLIIPSILMLFSCSPECEEPDIMDINSLKFQLDIDGENGFFSFELHHVYLVRFVPFSEPLVADTVYLNGVFPDGPGMFSINDEFPFLNPGSPYYPVYGYQVVDPSTGYVATIDNIELKGEYDGDCGYQNIQKSFVINGDTVDMGGTDTYYLISQ